MERSGLAPEISQAYRLIIGNGPDIHLVLNTGREYTFNCDDPMSCIIVFDKTTAIDEPEAPKVAVVDEQPESSKL